MKSPAVLRLGRINFVNVLPVHRHFTASPDLVREVPDVPSRLNRLLRAGGLDVGEVSSVEYAHGADGYLILPGLALCTAGPVGSVLLLSRLPMEDWGQGPIEAPFESETSVALLRVLLAKLWGLPCALAPEGREERPVAVLRIGDRAIREQASGRWPYVWDMGKVWHDWTGLPFVYALWVARADRAARHPGQMARLHQALLASRDAGLADLEGCAQEAERTLGGGLDFYRRYFTQLYYTLGPAELEGLRRFYDELAQAGLLPKPAALRFFELDQPGA